MLAAVSWGVTAWPPVGGLGGLRANSFTIGTVKTFTTNSNMDIHTHRQGLIQTHHTQTPTHCLNLLGHTLMDMHTELKAVPRAGLGFHFLRVQVRKPKKEEEVHPAEVLKVSGGQQLQKKTPIERTTR